MDSSGLLPAPRNVKSWATRRTVPFATSFAMICGSTVRTNWPQNGHWKSAQTSIVTGASALPSERPFARAAGIFDARLHKAERVVRGAGNAGARTWPNDEEDEEEKADDERSAGDEDRRILPARAGCLAPDSFALGVSFGEPAGPALLAARLRGGRATVQGMLLSAGWRVERDGNDAAPDWQTPSGPADRGGRVAGPRTGPNAHSGPSSLDVAT